MSSKNKWKMQVAGLTVDPARGDPVVLLRDEQNRHQLPIWIGQFEASAIAGELKGARPARPMTHDLLRNAMEAVGWDVVRVEISDLRDSTFYARVVVAQDDDEISIDSRPSDAIALALRAGATIWVHDHVLQQARMDPPDREAEDASDEEPAPRVFQGPAPTTDEEWKAYLEDLDPNALGSYKQ